MRFHPEHILKYYYKDHAMRSGKDYDYVWCAADVDVHSHEDFYEILFLAGSDAYHYHDGNEGRISQNTVFFFMPGEKHGIYKAEPEGIHFSFFAKPSFFNRFFEENSFLRNVFGNERYCSCELTRVEYEYIYRLVNLLVHQEGEYQKISLFLYNLLSLFILHNETRQASKEQNFVIDLVENLNNYTYLTTKISDIYSKYPIAQCTLIKKFKEYTGVTIAQYQRRQKLVYAAQLLISSDYQITEIAEILKFESLSHFLRIFKEQYAMTPKEYRKCRTQIM